MKILVVDDHVLIREALRGVFKELKPDATVLEAADGRGRCGCSPSILTSASSCSISACPTVTGSCCSRSCASGTQPYPVVVLSGYPDRANVVRALELGALGFIPKTARREVMMSALSLVFSGGSISRRKSWLEADAPDARRAAAAAGIARRSGIDRTAGRRAGADDARQEQQGDLPAARSRRTTVKNHVTAILKALKVSNRTEAVIAAAALGWELGAVSARRRAGAD